MVYDYTQITAFLMATIVLVTVLYVMNIRFKLNDALALVRASQEMTDRAQTASRTLREQLDTITAERDDLQEALNVSLTGGTREPIVQLANFGPSRQENSVFGGEVALNPQRLVILASGYDDSYVFNAHRGDCVVLVVEASDGYNYYHWEIPEAACGREVPLWSLATHVIASGRMIIPDAELRSTLIPFIGAYSSSRGQAPVVYAGSPAPRPIKTDGLQALANPPEPARPPGYRRLTIRRK